MKTAFDLLKATFKEWNADKAPRLAAALSYYTLFSMAPVLVIAIAMVGLVFGEEAASGQVFTALRDALGPDAAAMVQSLVVNARQSGAGPLAAGLAAITLVLGAMTVFGELRSSLNTIWEVEEKPRRGIVGIVMDRLMALLMVMVIGAVLLFSLGVSAALGAAQQVLGAAFPLPEWGAYLLDFGASLLVLTVLFTFIYKLLPQVKIAWRDVLTGAFVTGALFSLGKIGIGLYLAHTSTASSYGAGGAVVLVLLWVYYSAQVLFFGAEFTQVYANRHGSRVRPDRHGEPMVDATPRRQGRPATEGTSEAPEVRDEPDAAKRSRATAAAGELAEAADGERRVPAADERRDLRGHRLTDRARTVHVEPDDVEEQRPHRQGAIGTGAAMLVAAGILWKLRGRRGSQAED